MQPVRFLGSAKGDLYAFPGVGSGAREIRIRDEAGAFRVIYVAKFADAIYVLHAFQKKTQKAAKTDLELAARRYRIARDLSEGSSDA